MTDSKVSSNQAFTTPSRDYRSNPAKSKGNVTSSDPSLQTSCRTRVGKPWDSPLELPINPVLWEEWSSRYTDKLLIPHCFVAISMSLEKHCNLCWEVVRLLAVHENTFSPVCFSCCSLSVLSQNWSRQPIPMQGASGDTLRQIHLDLKWDGGGESLLSEPASE